MRASLPRSMPRRHRPLVGSGLCTFAVDRHPQLMTARHLYAKPTIGDLRPELNLWGEIVEHEIAAPGADEQHQMMLSGTDDDLAQQQGPRRPATPQEFVTFAYSVVIAVPAIGIDAPRLAGQAEVI